MFFLPLPLAHAHFGKRRGDFHIVLIVVDAHEQIAGVDFIVRRRENFVDLSRNLAGNANFAELRLDAPGRRCRPLGLAHRLRISRIRSLPARHANAAAKRVDDKTQTHSQRGRNTNGRHDRINLLKHATCASWSNP